MKRVISGVVLIAIAIFVIFYPTYIPLTVLVGVLSVWGLCELYKNVETIGFKPIWWLGILTTILFVIGSVFKTSYEAIVPEINEKVLPELNTMIQINGFNYIIPNSNESIDIMPLFPAIITALILIGFVVEFFRPDRAPVKNIGSTLFGACYVGWLFSHIASMKCLSGATTLFGKSISWGAVLVMLMIFCTCATDTFAFLVGKKFGKHKISPKSSPNKTWEGSIGGWFGSVIFGTIWGYLTGIPIIHCLIISAVCGIISQLGDLTESSIKREIGIKDFSNLIPGHGGVLDRIDSMLFTAPFIYYYAITFLPNLFK